jgi:hypothetical protein
MEGSTLGIALVWRTDVSDSTRVPFCHERQQQKRRRLEGTETVSLVIVASATGESHEDESSRKER